METASLGMAGAGEVQVGVRPEHARLVPAGQGRIEAQAVFNEALGAETLVHVRRAGASEMFTIRQDGSDPAPRAGEAVGVDWAECDMMRFSAKGRRL